ncbi:succinylglutamate desuccinylase/aspartoacylase family protein [Fodinicurvata halophila]|uniref:Succinylglutamate desuccinylase/aspartoacylase family protein n=1 Tax=Fodinicurvata halophila TaxID=1419723 RepID=A0ABV8UJ96_9PROT
MSHSIERQILKGSPPGTQRELVLHRFGPAEADARAYIQASLHADEVPAMLVAQHLLELLKAADAQAAIKGRITVVPYANPLGLSQFVNGVHLGRYNLPGGGNYNRLWPDLYDLIRDELRGRLGPDANTNKQLIRQAMKQAVTTLQVHSELEHLKQLLAREACDADLVLDLHCDDDALMHLYLTPEHWPAGTDLAADLECRAVLLASDSGGGSFDEAFSTPWPRLADAFPEHPIPRDACFSATVELRGQADVDDTLAAEDARALYRELQRRGLVAGLPSPAKALQCEATALEACELAKSPASGILSYRKNLGERVAKGDVIADLVDPSHYGDTASRQEIRASTDGVLLTRRLHKYVRAGDNLAKIVGTEPLPERTGLLLED